MKKNSKNLKNYKMRLKKEIIIALTIENATVDAFRLNI